MDSSRSRRPRLRSHGPRSAEARRALFPEATDARVERLALAERHAVRSLEQLERLRAADRRRARGRARRRPALFRMGISPYYLSLIDPEHPFCPVRMQAIPVRAEARVRPGELADPLGEDKTRPGGGHRPQVPGPGAVPRARHAARSTAATAPAGASPRAARRSSTKDAAAPRASSTSARHPEVRDVLISGGDPFLLSRRAAGGAARAAPRDSPRGDDPHRHARAGVPADAGDRRAGAHAAPLRAASTWSPTSTTRRRSRPRRARPASGWWTTACRWRTRRC